jgi:hypothetical protein
LLGNRTSFHNSKHRFVDAILGLIRAKGSPQRSDNCFTMNRDARPPILDRE